MQVIAGFRQDRRLLEISKSLEWAWNRIPWLERPLPDLDKLRARPAVDFKSIVKFPPDAPATQGGASEPVWPGQGGA